MHEKKKEECEWNKFLKEKEKEDKKKKEREIKRTQKGKEKAEKSVIKMSQETSCRC